MRDFGNRQSWSYYHAKKATEFPYCGTAAFQLTDGYNGKDMFDTPAVKFLPYWHALECERAGKKLFNIERILQLCKTKYAAEVEKLKGSHSVPENYKGYTLEWTRFMSKKEQWNGCGTETLKCVLPFKVTEEEKRELENQLEVKYIDPYHDGRDCTGAPFTSWIGIYTAADKTFIYHSIERDF